MPKTLDLQDLLIRLERLEAAQARNAVSMEVESLVLRDRDGMPRALEGSDVADGEAEHTEALAGGHLVAGCVAGGGA
jgi:hypothetical protein